MKIQSTLMVLIMLCCAAAFTNCKKDSGTDNSIFFLLPANTVNVVSYSMAYVPGGLTFPTGEFESGTATVANAYWIGETEVTYELWYAVYAWATNAARGANRYTFTFGANAPRAGNDGIPGEETTSQEPVTYVNWRHAMAWTNALTEFYNATNGSVPDLDCVYYTDSGYTTPIRSADDNGTITYPDPGSQDDPYIKPGAKGFRLLTRDEWELAARYIDDANDDSDITDAGEYYPGTYASGSDADYDDTTGASDYDGDGDVQYSGDVSVYSTTSTAVVKSKTTGANALGLSDMSGNVWEWCFDWYTSGTSRVRRGGCWNFGTNMLLLAYAYGSEPSVVDSSIGFRFARTE